MCSGSEAGSYLRRIDFSGGVPQVELLAGLGLGSLDPFFQADQHLRLKGYLAHKKTPPPMTLQ